MTLRFDNNQFVSENLFLCIKSNFWVLWIWILLDLRETSLSLKVKRILFPKIGKEQTWILPLFVFLTVPRYGCLGLVFSLELVILSTNRTFSRIVRTMVSCDSRVSRCSKVIHGVPTGSGDLGTSYFSETLVRGLWLTLGIFLSVLVG